MGINRLQPAAAPSGAPFTRIATVSTTSTWTHPDGASPSSPKWIRVIMYGGGGGGGQGGKAKGSGSEPQCGGGGGGGGGYAFVNDFLLTGTLPVTIGAGGAGAAAYSATFSGEQEGVGNYGSAGGTTICGDFRIGGGGAGGNHYGRPYNVGDQTGGGGGLGLFSFTGTGLTSGGYGGASGDSYASSTALKGYTASTNGTLSFQVPAQAAGGTGGSAAWRYIAGDANTSVLTTNIGTGGTGGAGGVASGNGSTATSGAGGNASGYASGGGGAGGACVRSSSGTATVSLGKGGDGSPGVVFIYY